MARQTGVVIGMLQERRAAGADSEGLEVRVGGSTIQEMEKLNGIDRLLARVLNVREMSRKSVW